MDSASLHQEYSNHLQKVVDILAYTGTESPEAVQGRLYATLAGYVAVGFTEPIDRTDLYLRLLACTRAEQLPLPSVRHMQALMTQIWNGKVPHQGGLVLQELCQHISEVLCYEIGKFATESMQAIAATLRVDLQVELGYEQDHSDLVMTQEPQKTDDKEADPPVPVDGTKTIH